MEETKKSRKSEKTEKTDKSEKGSEKPDLSNKKPRTVPEHEARCMKINTNGDRCKNGRSPNSEFCSHHTKASTDKKPKESKK